jgi:hypothetical protein
MHCLETIKSNLKCHKNTHLDLIPRPSTSQSNALPLSYSDFAYKDELLLGTCKERNVIPLQFRKLPLTFNEPNKITESLFFRKMP